MPWLRLDERFATNPKVAALSNLEFRVWVRAMLYCSTHRTDGKLPVSAEVKELTDAMRKTFRSLKLLDVKRGFDYVHDWDEYNPSDPTAAERAKRYRVTKASRLERDEHRDADRDETVTSHVGTPARSRTHTEPITEPQAEPKDIDPAAAGSTPGTAAANELRIRLRELGWREWQVSAGLADPDRAYAWLKKATKEAQVNPGGYAWTGFSSGDEPGLSAPDGGRITGCSFVRGSHGSTHIVDPLGTDQPPFDWPHPKPGPKEIKAALKAKAEMDALVEAVT